MKMNIDLTSLNTNHSKEIIIENKHNFSKEEIEKTELLDLSEIVLSGSIIKDNLGDYLIDLVINGVMTLSCAITLKPVKHPFSINVNGNLYDLLKEIDENTKKIENSIDILPIIWENILMEIPMKVVSEDVSDAKVEGNGWKLVTEEETEKINPALASLKDLF